MKKQNKEKERKREKDHEQFKNTELKNSRSREGRKSCLEGKRDWRDGDS